MKSLCVLAVSVVLLTLSAYAETASGVPSFDVDIMDRQDVVAWWSEHPLKPEYRDRLKGIVHPAHTINVKTEFDGDLEKAIAAVPPEGATLLLPTGEYRGGFKLFKSHVHFLGRPGTVIKGERIEMAACPEMLDYRTMCPEWRVKNNPRYLECWEQRLQDIYFSNVTFDGNGSVNVLVRITTCNGILFDDCVFQNGAARSGARLVSGCPAADGMAFRNCMFSGQSHYCVYVDGAYGPAFIGCQFSNPAGSGVLAMCNEDFTKDINGNKKFDKFERRNTQYLVAYDCSFSNIKVECFGLTANDVLLKNNKVEGPVRQFVRFNTKTSLINKTMRHESYGLNVINNHADKARMLVLIDSTQDYMPEGQNNKSRLGRYVVEGNRGSWDTLVKEVGEIDGPNRAQSE